MDHVVTELTRLLEINTPVVSAPMAGASGGALAAAVTLGGGFGFIGVARMTPEMLKHELSSARSLLHADNPLVPLPIGVGFLGWRLELPDSPEVELLTIVLENNVKAVWFAFGNDTRRWLQLVRDHDQKSGNNHKTLVFVQISSLDEAQVAIRDWGVDVIVAQDCSSHAVNAPLLHPGIEAGGHGHSSAPPLLTLVPSIISVLPKPGPILIAAGGLSQGAHVAAMLALGASGAVLGTRFLLTPESLYSDVQKQALIGATSTVRSVAFDHVRDTLGWPSGVDGRGLYNSTVEEFEKGVSLEQVKSKYSAEDPSRVVVWSGTGVALMSAIKPAKEIVQELHQECLARLQAMQTLIIPA